jgi:hypothetical protein
MSARIAALFVCLCLGSCTFYLGRQASSRETTRTADEAVTTADPATHERQCSGLRADIASSRYNQRNAPPTTSVPIIAEANDAKAQKKIDDLQKRYDDMGCVGPAQPIAPVNQTAPGPAADNPLAK